MIYMLMKIVFLKKRRVDLNNKSNHSKPEGSLLTKEILKQEEKRAEENSIGETSKYSNNNICSIIFDYYDDTNVIRF